jgi:MFS family permease
MSSFPRGTLDRWVERGLITGDQRDAILAFEQAREREQEIRQPGDAAPGRLANAISTVGAAVAIGAVAGIMGIVTEDWHAAQTMVAAAIGSVIMIAAAWDLVRSGWGAPAGLFAICGLALMPVALGFGANALGWWPEGFTDAIERRQQRVIGGALLLSILPGALTLRLGLRQGWAALPAALWFGVTLLFTNTFENISLVVTQVVLGAVVAGVALLLWMREEAGRDWAWWLQVGGLLLAAQGIILSAFEDRAVFALLGVMAAAVIFTIGVVRNRTAWIVAGAVPALVPSGRLIFEYFEGVGGLFLIAILGLGLAFLPLVLRRNKDQPIAWRD